MAINVGQLIVKKKEQAVLTQPAPQPTPKKKVNILTKRNRTQIFNFDKSSPYLEDLLTRED